MAPTIDEQVRMLMYGTEYGDDTLRDTMSRELRKRLEEARDEGRPLRVYAGYDPTRPDLHIGHAISIRKLRQFQDFGHHVIFLVGTFTAQVGDTSDKTSGRPRLSAEEIKDAARSYAEQCFKILDREKTEVLYNGDWLSPLTLADVVNLASHFTVQQFLARDNYRKRIEANNPVGLHEFFYALLQGYDAVHLRADVQLGATEQLFNILAGRKLQEAFGQKPCICITFPILVGTEGTKRMSKSAGNYVGLSDAPEDQYGKVMSISDQTMLEWIKYVTRWSVDEIEAHAARVKQGDLHPMELKKKLAREVVATYHGDQAADTAQRHFETVHQRGQLPEDIAELSLDGPTSIIEVLAGLEGVGSKGKARRLIDGRGVRVDSNVVDSYDLVVESSCLLQVGKRRFLKLVVG
jgi:tyrosyl-tRNA synthetase